MKSFLFAGLLLLTGATAKSQDGFNGPSIGVHSGIMNYQGDLNPNSFSFKNSNPFISVYFTQPITTKLNLRAGVTTGTIEAADRHNRGYLVPRNLSFQSAISDVYGGLELNILDPEKYRITPFIFLGAAMFHFDPWTLDETGEKVYLQPLGTEGQGLSDYPNRQPYKLTQLAAVYSGGLRFTLSQSFSFAIELSQRKTFTDYLDDVSSDFADREKLLAGRGQRSVDLAYRGDELSGGSTAYPRAGEQRGTPTENDWYYMLGVNMQVKLSAVRDKIKAVSIASGSSKLSCPSIF